MFKPFEQIKSKIPGIKVIRQFDRDSGEKLLLLMKEFNIRSFVEVGVLCGDMTKYLCDNYNFDKYHAIDSWLRTNYGLGRFTQREMDTLYQFCLDRFKGLDNIKVLRMDSINASELFEDNSVDCVFIDAAHDAKRVLKDINAWFPKVKKLLIGHDYVVCGGVKQAVDSALPQRKIYNNLWYIIK